MNFERLGEHLIKMLSSNGGISFGRAASLLMLLLVLTWDTSYVYFIMAHWKALFAAGVTIHDVLPRPETMLGQVTFISAPYTINKLNGKPGPDGQ